MEIMLGHVLGKSYGDILKPRLKGRMMNNQSSNVRNSFDICGIRKFN